MELYKIGMLTPSSNTVLEPITNKMLQNVPQISVHYARFKVKEVSLQQSAYEQFSLDPMLEAARMLSDAKVDVIAYNGTSGGWMGFEKDLELCKAITKETGIPATTSVLALNELFDIHKVKQFGIVSPCEREIVNLIVKNYNDIGLNCAAMAYAGVTSNYACAKINEEEVKAMVRKVAVPGIGAITTFGTNLWAAHLVDELEGELNVPIFDTISVVVHKCLDIIGIPPQSIVGWGGLFEFNSVAKS